MKVTAHLVSCWMVVCLFSHVRCFEWAESHFSHGRFARRLNENRRWFGRGKARAFDYTVPIIRGATWFVEIGLFDFLVGWIKHHDGWQRMNTLGPINGRVGPFAANYRLQMILPPSAINDEKSKEANNHVNDLMYVLPSEGLTNAIGFLSVRWLLCIKKLYILHNPN